MSGEWIMENFNFITFNFCLIPCAPLCLNASVANSLLEKTKPIFERPNWR